MVPVVPALEEIAPVGEESVPAAWKSPRGSSTLPFHEDLSLASEPLTPERLAAKDAVVIVTDHSDVDYELVLRHAQLIVDSRGVYRRPMPRVVKA